jgi:hypothetical protein
LVIRLESLTYDSPEIHAAHYKCIRHLCGRIGRRAANFGQWFDVLPLCCLVRREQRHKAL